MTPVFACAQPADDSWPLTFRDYSGNSGGSIHSPDPDGSDASVFLFLYLFPDVAVDSGGIVHLSNQDALDKISGFVLLSAQDGHGSDKRLLLESCRGSLAYTDVVGSVFAHDVLDSSGDRAR